MSPGEIVRGGRLPGKTARWIQRIVLERRYGMRSGALRDVDLRDIGFDAPGRVHEHIPSPWGVLARIVRRREIQPQDVFIDIGCGQGPVLVEAAARYDFRRVIGIDVVPEFTEVAEDTIARARDRLRCKDVEVVTQDILEYGFPDDVTVVYMADPFRWHLFDAAVAKMIESVDRRPRVLRVIYNMPVEGGRLERTGRAQLVRFGRRRNRPWMRAPDLAMYEISPVTNGAGAPVPLRNVARPGLRGPHLPNRRPDQVSTSGNGSRGYSAPPGAIKLAAGRSASGSKIASNRSNEELEWLRTAFDRYNCVRLPGFLGESLLSRIRDYIDEGEFTLRRYGGGRTDFCMEEGKAAELLLLHTNDPHLFEFVRAVTGCKPIGGFEAGIYRMPPGPEHGDAWHGEIFGHGMVAMSIDLSARPYSGGVLEIRDRHSGELLHRATGMEPGDALILRLAPSLQHRVTPVEGDVPRTVYAGRMMLFKSTTYSKLARPRSVV